MRAGLGGWSLAANCAYVLYHRGLSNDAPQHFHDYGWYIYATPNLRFDIRIGQQLTRAYDQWFAGAGISARF
jgi:hypothetical protein